jgi:hypothetical protein
MSLFSERLMKWREPKMKGMVTPKNMLLVLALIVVVSIPFGFLGGNGKFNISICFIALGFMSFASIGLLIAPLLPGILIQLKEDMIVRGARGTNSQRSAYKDIDCIYLNRDCSSQGQNFSIFSVVMKNDVIEDDVIQFSYATFRSVHQFTVPESVNVEQVLQILRDKGVKVVERPQSS